MSLPLHKEKLERLCAAAAEDARLVGVIVVGSLATGQVDAYSDVDTKIIVEDASFEEVLADREQLVAAAGRHVAAFTAEHVGFPEMTIALYADLVHVDFHFVRFSDLTEGWTALPHFVAYERDGRVSDRLGSAQGTRPAPDPAWLEARIWTWIWYTHTKILRGELYEALDALQYLRGSVLFPLLALTRDLPAAGSRRAENYVGHFAARFARTVPRLDAGDMLEALEEIAALYLELADPILQREGVPPAEDARATVRAALAQGLAWRPEPPQV